MSSLLLPRRFYSQPQGAVRLAINPPIHLINFGNGIVAAGQPATYTPIAITLTAGAAVFNGTTSNIEVSAGALGIASGYALISTFIPRNLSAVNGLMTRDYSLDGDRVFQFRIETSGAIGFYRFDSSENLITNLSGGSVILNKINTAVALFNGSGSYVFLNGALVASDSVTTANSDLSNADTKTIIGCGYSSTAHAKSLFFVGSMQLAGILPPFAADYESLSANPWQIFKVSE